MHLLGATIKSQNRGAEPAQPRCPLKGRGAEAPGIMRRVGRAGAAAAPALKGCAPPSRSTYGTANHCTS